MPDSYNYTNISIDNDWFNAFDKPFVIAGPCSAESREQLLKTARLLKQIPEVKVFRAGIWKPRTRPGDFEGFGSKALPWLQEVKQETGLPLTTEVANPKHVEEALAHDIDMLWIGARTIVNPFSVQELAESLKGCRIPILVKNPLNPDIKLWIGAIERMEKSGVSKIAAIHRGFHYYTKSPYRNAPMWEIAIELKRLLPNLPLITDISHISGKRELLPEVAQKAFDLETDGLMIESHYNPLIAKTDATQQIAPEALKLLLSHLVIRQSSEESGFEHQLESLRTEIDKLDGELLQILARRMDIVAEIGHYKQENKITILQLKRWRHIIEDRLAMGSNLGLDKGFLLKLLKLVHAASIQEQESIFKKSTDSPSSE